jgi:hypothetical protein
VAVYNDGMSRVTRLVVYSQIAFLICIGLCVIILPHYVFERDEGGMSNYGVHASTVVFYTLAFTLSSVLLLLARRALPASSSNQPLRLLFLVIAYSLLLELLSTYYYQHGTFYDQAHLFVNIWLAVIEFIAGAWIALFWRRNTLNLFLAMLLLFSTILLVLVFMGRLHILFLTQLLSTVTFGSLLARSSLDLDVRTNSQLDS